MTAQVLASELSLLIQESKRKNADIRIAAEKSLSDLRALPNTSEAQLAADLKRRPNFVRPFLLSCATRNPKYAGIAIVCLQRLVISRGLAPETLKDVLDVLQECTSLGLDIQLKILQALPSLLQNYASQLTDTLLATALHVCFLLHGSKTAVVSNTAAATLQQVVVSVLGKVAEEDERSSEPNFVAEVPIDDGTISVQSATLDAYQLLNDLCLMTEGQKPQFLRPTSVSSNFGLELIEAMVSNHADIISSHPEQIHIIRIRLMPYMIRILSERVAFSTTVRVMRLLLLVLENMLSVLATECEMALGLLNHMLDPDAAILWKRVLCMEVFRGVHTEPSLVRSIYAHYDEQEGKRNIIRDHLAIMVRLAAEKPSIIGLGQQSSIPASSSDDELEEQAALQAEGIAGTIGAAISLRSSLAPGISTKWSNMKVPCIDQLDKSEPPPIPPAYIYSLALTCMNSFSEGLARFLLPFSILNEVKSKRKPRQAKEGDEQQEAVAAEGFSTPSSTTKPQISSIQPAEPKFPINPLTLENHVLYSQIHTSADMIDSCWPALLAAYSTFFHAALDMEYYHALVRSFQKFSQVAGLLRLTTPRDAFLTMLGKNAVPPAVISAYSVANLSVNPGETRDLKRRSSGIQDSEDSSSSSGVATKSRQSIDNGNTSLNTRNLLCLRALLNLGIALGPVLQGAWSIVLEALQQADLVITYLSLQRRNLQNGQMTPTGSSENGYIGDIGNEISAVQLAATRMLESCGDLPDDAFLDVLSSFKGLLRDLHHNPDLDTRPFTLLSPRPAGHLRRVSTAGAVSGIVQDVRLNTFVVENITKLFERNPARLLRSPTDTSGWDVIVDTLVDILSTREFDPDLRLKAATSLSDLVGLTAGPETREEDRDFVRKEGLAALTRQIRSLYLEGANENKSSKACEMQIHWLSLEALRGSLEKYGDSLELGWEHVFTVIGSVFEERRSTNEKSSIEDQIVWRERYVVHAKSSKLVRSSFGSLQLICSDFLNSIPPACLARLLKTIKSFCAQREEFNIALTSTTLYWNISGHLLDGQDSFTIQEYDSSLAAGTHLATTGLHQLETFTRADMWLHLLLFLIDSTVDQRQEIRHSALHTMFRILDGSCDKLDSAGWIVCLRVVILGMLCANDEMFQRSKAAELSQQDTDLASWNETAIVILDNISSVLSSYLQAVVSQAGFENIWKALMAHYQLLLHRMSLNLSASVYSSLSKLLSTAKLEDVRFSSHTYLAWDLWRDGNPVEHTEITPSNSTDNQAALIAYMQCLVSIYHLTGTELKLEGVNMILTQLLKCAIGSTPTSYSGDIDTMTPLQVHILDCVRMIQTDASCITSVLIRSISSFVTLAYDRELGLPGRSGPTFIALSKAAMDMLKDCITANTNAKDIYLNGSLSQAIDALGKPMRLKYRWYIEGKDPPPWKKATTTIVNILKCVVPTLQLLNIKDSEMSSIWRGIISCCNAIISNDIPSEVDPARVWSDQAFDISAFQNMANLLIPVLGSSIVSDKIRRAFAESLFQNSVIHEPHPDDLPQPGDELFQCLRSTHIGRVQDLPPSLRSKMSYELFDLLFDLIAEHDGSPERIKLAQAAAPYLILRVGIVLKAYNSDQPLRARMPQPGSQRQEMLYTLHKLVELQSEAQAIPDAPGVVSRHRKHLYRVYGLVIKALGVTRCNEEMQKALTCVIEAISDDFGI